METLWQDLRFGVRLLLSKPGFALIAVVSLAFGIGANTAIFSLVDAVLLRPLPFREPERLVIVWEDATRIGFPRNTPAPANYADWKSQNRVFEDMAALSWQGHRRMRGALIVTEVALALVLLVGAGLLIRTFVRLRALDIGLNPENVLTLRTTLPLKKYGELAKRTTFYQHVLERVRSLPGVVSAGYTTAVPLTWKGGTNSFTVEGHEPGPGQDANFRQVSPGYMEAIGIKLREGRYLTDQDDSQARPVAIINATMARQFWQGENALGRRFKLDGDESQARWLTVVGVVGDVKEMGLEAPAKPEMFFPYQQLGGTLWNIPRDLIVRTTGDPLSITPALRQAIWSVDSAQPISNIRTMRLGMND